MILVPFVEVVGVSQVNASNLLYVPAEKASVVTTNNSYKLVIMTKRSRCQFICDAEILL